MKSIGKFCVASALALGLGVNAQAAVIFNFDYIDAPGVGFNAAGQTGADRRDALANAGNYLSGFLSSYTADIFMTVDGSISGSSTLAAATTRFSTPPSLGFSNQGDVMHKILGGNAADPNPSGVDAAISWNFSDFSWEFGNNFQLGEFDFFSTALHELAHTLGFFSGITQNGTDFVTGTPNVFWTPFDDYIADAAGDLINDVTFSMDQGRWNAASTAGGGCGTGLLFNGPNAMAANGGNAVEIYSPSTWQSGSSGSHLDDPCYNGTYAMEATTFSGLGVRQISQIEVGIFRDIGYSQFGVTVANQIPEPGTISMFAAGLLLLSTRRKRSLKNST